MAVTLPNCYTEVHDSEVDLNRPVSDETVRKIIQNVNMLAELAKIGQILSVAINQPGVPSPNPNLHQQCDGSEIIQSDSPLRSTSGTDRFTPNLIKFFIRGADDEDTNSQTAVDLTNNLQHNHSGFTGYFDAIYFIGEEGDERHSYQSVHRHGINNDQSAADPIDPAHLKVLMYLKIN